MKDSEFDDLLRTTRDDVPLPLLFHQEVWQRIENAEADRSPEIVRFPPVMAAIARPWGAVAGVAAMVTLGLWLGAATVPEGKDAKLAYAQSISPFAHSNDK
ncbi:MAG: hypothetical protein ABIT37_20455 [Luteolibacter sp.]